MLLVADGSMDSDSRTGLEFTHNLLNLPCDVKDVLGNMKLRYTYLSDGTKVSALDADSAFRYRYAGKEEQRFGAFDSQLLVFGARYYDPWSCQWTAVDPMAEEYLGMSPFGYCACDPMDLVDINGMNWYSNNGNYIWRDS